MTHLWRTSLDSGANAHLVPYPEKPFKTSSHTNIVLYDRLTIQCKVKWCTEDSFSKCFLQISRITRTKSQKHLNCSVPLYRKLQNKETSRQDEKLNRQKETFTPCLLELFTHWMVRHETFSRRARNQCLKFLNDYKLDSCIWHHQQQCWNIPTPKSLLQKPTTIFFNFHSLEDVPFCFFIQVHTLH